MKIILISIITANLLLAQEELSVITVNAKQDSTSTSITVNKINKTQIDNSLSGNGFISSILEKNPNIRVNDTSTNSSTAGEITPGKISINDAPFYQNNFQIDGISNSSLIDPNLSGVNDPYDVPGNENEIFLDLDLIESIDIYDSNISAEYGNFTGGVIDVKTIRAGEKFSGKISYKHTSDKLTTFHVNNDENFQQANSDNKQAKFEKNFYSLYLTSPIDENNGLIFSYNRKQSIIPGAYFGGFIDKERLNQSFFSKWSHYFEDDSILDISATYSPYESTHILEYVKDSHTLIKGGGASIKANYEKDYDFWNLTSSFAIKHSQNSKESSNYNKRWKKKISKDWGPITSDYSSEGGTGSIEKKQEGLAYKIKFSSDSFKKFSLNHKIKTGLELSYNNAQYNRKDNMYYYSDAQDNYLVDCNGDNESCSQNEQYFKSRRVFQAEKIDASILSSALFIEDSLQYKNFEFTPGLRVDYNNYLKNTDFSYRLNSSIKPFDNNKTVIYAGLNRYYGKSFLGYKLREARLPYYEQERSTLVGGNTVSDWGTTATNDSSKYIFSSLDTPYTDEASLGLRQDISNVRFNLKYVHRNAKAKFSKEKGDNQIFTKPDGITKDYYRPTTFTNSGYSKSDILSLTVGPTKALEFSSFNLGYNLSTSIRKTKSNIDHYDDIVGDQEREDINKIYYNGKFYDKNKLPKQSTPKNVNLHLNMAFKPISIFGQTTRIRLNQIIKYNLSYNDILKRDGDQKETYTDTLPNGNTKDYDVDIYDKVKFKKVMTLNLKASFDFKFQNNKSLIINTEINNVFDKVQNVQYQSSNFKTGRQYWLNISYKF